MNNTTWVSHSDGIGQVTVLSNPQAREWLDRLKTSKPRPAPEKVGVFKRTLVETYTVLTRRHAGFNSFGELLKVPAHVVREIVFKVHQRHNHTDYHGGYFRKVA